MSGSSEHHAGARRGGEGLILGAAAVAAYVGFAAVMIFDDGARARHSAQAGVPVDAVRAATAASRDARAAAAVRSPTGADAVSSRPRANTADAVSNTSVLAQDRGRGSAAVGAAGAGDGVVGVDTGDGGARLQFIVKFEPAEATRWRDRFLADAEGTRAEWARFAASSSAFAGLRMQLPPNSSGVATLELEGEAPGSPAAAQELSADIVRRLNAAAGVDYAEPNLVGLREETP
jgi:hypothetical protein